MSSGARSSKSERLLNLLIMLLAQRGYSTKDRIRAVLYPGTGPDAFEKMFERDKEELRSLGVPIEVGSHDAYFDDEPGYRIRPDEFALPDVDLDAEEAAVVALATRVWEHATLARATTDAVRKLSAAGADVDLSGLDIARPRLRAEEPAFDVFFESVQDRCEVVFDYLTGGRTEAQRRRLQTWGVVRNAGRWYAVGHDVDRGATRVFRLSRVQGTARRTGRPGAYEVPPGTDVRAIARNLGGSSPDVVTATLLVREGTGHSLRRSAADGGSVQAGVPGPDQLSGWDRLVLQGAASSLADEVLAHGPDVVVVDPAPLRDRVLHRLREAIGSAAGEAGEGAR